MALGFTQSSGGGGDFTAIVKYDGKAGRMFRVDRIQDASGAWDKTQVDVTNNFKAMFDFENIEVGYINFPMGGAPDFVMVPFGDPFPQRPSDNHKQGVRFMLKLASTTAGDADPIRELSGNSNVFRSAIDELHDAYTAQKAANPGKLPIVSLKSAEPVTSGSGTKKSTNYQPIFEIVGWAARPADLVFAARARTSEPARPAAQSAPSTGSTPVPPPAAKQAAMAEEDFG